MGELELTLRETQELFRQAEGPFPYAGCRYVLSRADPGNEDLVPDLDMYWATIAGFASSASSVRRWPSERQAQALEATTLSFFEEHPEYERLQWYINECDTPDLLRRIETYELIRQALRKLVALAMSHEEA